VKLKFEHQAYQADAVRAVVDCFQGQPKSSGLKYAVDAGAVSQGHVPLPGTEMEGFAKAAQFPGGASDAIRRAVSEHAKQLQMKRAEWS
jgi:restriction endonuclease